MRSIILAFTITFLLLSSAIYPSVHLVQAQETQDVTPTYDISQPSVHELQYSSIVPTSLDGTEKKPLIKFLIILTILRTIFNNTKALFQQRTPFRDGIQWLEEHPWIAIIAVLVLNQIYSAIRSNRLSNPSDGVLPENKPPVAHIEAPTMGEIDTEISFSADMSYDEDGTIESYIWDFGDNVGGRGKNIQHRYVHAGTYTVTLTVIDDSGVRDSESMMIIISNYETDTEEDPIGSDSLILFLVGGISVMIGIGIAFFIMRKKNFIK